MKSQIRQILLISYLGIFIISCQKQSPCAGLDLSDVTTNYNLSEADKGKISYTGFDTLVFKSDAGDTATLFGRGKQQSYDRKLNNHGSIDCQKWYIHNCENLELVFTGYNSALEKIYCTVYMDDYSNEAAVRIWMNYPTPDYWKIGDGSFAYINARIAIPDDSIFLNGSYQPGVYIKNVLFNFSKGILKFKDINNGTWTKLK